jgi:hypothetical protein
VLSPYLNEMRQQIETKRPFTSITTCALTLGPFYFSDGTRWASYSGFQKPDPSVRGNTRQLRSKNSEDRQRSTNRQMG